MLSFSFIQHSILHPLVGTFDMNDGHSLLANIESGFVFLDCLKMNELKIHKHHESAISIDVFSTAR